MPDYVAEWVQVTIEAPEPQADAAADFLTQLTGAGVQINDVAGRPGICQVIGYMDKSGDVAAMRAAVDAFAANLVEDTGPGETTLRFDKLAGQDWGENWKRNFKPRAITPGLVVAPPWEKVRVEPDQHLIIIDPGQAFGTGQHESTLMCLYRLEGLANKGRMGPQVLDVGGGSGILSLAAVLMGAERALAIDIDPEAVSATIDNARLNGLEDRVVGEITPLEEVPGRFDVVLANLTAKDLLELARPLREKVAPGGYLICSGMLAPQAPAVRAAMEALGLYTLEQDALAGWAALVLT